VAASNVEKRIQGRGKKTVTQGINKSFMDYSLVMRARIHKKKEQDNVFSITYTNV